MDKIYKKMIEDSSIGYSCHKIIFDNNDLPYDYEWIETNKAFEKYTSLKSEELQEGKINKILPESVKKDQNLIDLYEKIIVNEKSKEYVKYIEETGRWCKFHVYLPEKYYIIIYCKDITETKINLLDKSEDQKRILWQLMSSIRRSSVGKDKDFKHLRFNKELIEMD